MAKPNVLFILADDLGYADLSAYGRRDYETPHLDRLSREGIKLTHGYSNSPVCSATRVSLLTGQYQYRYPLGLQEPVLNYVFDSELPSERAKSFVPLPTDIETLPGQFKKRGYSTHLVGKWHLGRLPDNGPRSYGYDTFFGFLGGATDYFRHRMFLDGDKENDGLVVNDEFVEREGYLTTLLGDEADKVIREQSKEGSKPWLLSLHFNAPHWPWEGPDDAGLAENLKDLLALEGNIRKYGEIVKAMDDEIGRIVQTLKDTNQYENTIIVFTSDNGGERFSDNWPFIGVKTELLEGGLRVPLILSWPHGFTSTSGTESSQVMTSMDFYPTLLGLVDRSDKQYEQTDGENLSQVFTGRAEEKTRRLFWRYKAYSQRAVLEGDWKYLRINEREYLFNINRDERERSDFRKSHPQIFDDLKAKWEQWDTEMLAYPEKMFSYNVKPNFADRY